MKKDINLKIKNELFVINEYDVQHQDPEAKASKELIEAFEGKINTNTHY